MRNLLTRLGLPLLVAAATLGVFLTTSSSRAAVSCPSTIPVVNENNCKGEGSSAWLFNNYDEGIAGFATQTSFNLGSSVPLKIARDTPSPGGTKVNIAVYRMGYYGGEGGRQVYTASNVTVNNNFTCKAMDKTTGELSCSNWSVTQTIPSSSLTSSGVYVAKLTTVGGTVLENNIVFVVRNDSSTSKIIYVLPTADYQAYNSWGSGKSLYFDRLGGSPTVSGTGRAVKVSFDRPLFDNNDERDRFFGPDFEMLEWLEKQGYDVSYTDDVSVHQNGAQLKNHKVVLVPGHSEYWSLEQFKAFEAARAAGTSLASFSANTAYWKVRYENGSRTLVCYKTVQGDGSGSSGSISPNDWGPDGIQGTADDALGLDGEAGTSDDRPENSTTTFRDNGAPKGDPNAPPGGRVGPDMPENSLWGVMYFGDDAGKSFPLTIPAGDATDQYAADRVWRNTGIAENTTTSIGSEIVGWEWDSVPTQPQYLAHQPAGVKRLTSTNTGASGSSVISWLLDEGRQRTNFPPPGMDGTVNAVRYTAPSGARVFASGSMRWSRGLGAEADPRIEQATYNILSDMGAQPTTPEGVTLDPGGTNIVPTASFTLTPNPVGYNTTVTFNASASNDSDGKIAKYEWDLDGNGSYETSSTTNATATRKYTSDAAVSVRLRVTDNKGATDISIKTLNVIGNQFPVASFTATPNPVIQGLPVSFNASASSDPDGKIAKYEWDRDGNGSYETSSTTNATTSFTYATSGTVQVSLRVTDNGGKQTAVKLPVTISVSGVSSYPDAVKDTPGLIHYWRLGETSGTTFADSAGTAPATTTGSPALGVSGGIAGDADLAAHFDGADDTANAAVDLSGLSTITVEFWLYVDSYTNDDAMTLEHTANFNQNKGGFLIDPNAPQSGGKFGVGIGTSETRNDVYFERPSAGQWHHYAFVLDAAAPAETQITPYVDGKTVAYTKAAKGTGSGAFANSTLNFMSRNGTGYFERGGLDDVAIYNRALSAAQILEHEQSFGANRRPVAAFTAPSPVATGVPVSFNASGSKDPDGTIVKYEWDLDGNGSYETNTGSTQTASRTFAASGEYTVGLRVTDNLTGIDTTTRILKAGPQPPTASFTANPNPAVVGGSIHYDASLSSDSDGTIVKYEWDLDGNGSYETNTGATAAADRVYGTPGTFDIGLRVTDNGGSTATTTLPVTINGGGVSNYGDSVLDTPGLVAYWRLGEASGPSFADSQGTATGTATAGVAFKQPGAVAGDPNTAAGFAGTGSAKAPLNLSATSKATVEFWLKWDNFADDDALALELTENFNANDGGFIVDPNAPQEGGKFGVGIGNGPSRNTVFFVRPSVAQWHHYAFVFDTTAAPTQQITPYVDGQAVAYTKSASGTGAGKFANSTLNFMSRNGEILKGHGALDEVAIYNRALTGSEIAAHRAANGANQKPKAALSIAPNPVSPGGHATFDASASKDPDGTISKYEWDLDGNGTYETNTGTTPTASANYATEAEIPISVKVYDNNLAIDTETKTLKVGGLEPQPPVASYSAQPNPAVTSIPVHFNAAASKDSDGTIVKYEWDLDGNGTYETDTGTTPTTERTYGSAATVQTHLRVTDNSGMTDAAVLPLTVNGGGVSNYGDTVLDTSGLVGYWRLGEAAGPNLADSKGVATGSALNGTVFGSAGALAGDPNTALGFDGVNDFGSVPLNLSGTSQATIEFWLNWNAYDNEDDLALELTENFNANNGGFIVDPNAAQGSFGVGIGIADSRNNVFFARPSAGQWHHYAFVLDSSAAPAQQVTPYVDGQPVSYSKTATGTGAGKFANSTLYLMSRAGQGLFGQGALDELAVYSRALSAAEIAEHDASYGLNRRPHAVLSASPNPAVSGEQVKFDATGSNDPDGSIVKYQWDLDGNGSFETDTGTTPSASISTSQAGPATVTVRVLDNDFATDTETKTVTVKEPEAPPPPPPPPVSYSQAVLATPGLVNYWRLNEASGATALADSVGASTASTGGATLGLPGSLALGAAGFDGVDDFAQAAVDLSGDSRLTVEFWMRWNAFADNDALAMEFTPNFNGNDGGFLIDPNAEQGSFGVGIGNPETRNNVYFSRPSGGQWHHYAFVLDTTAPVAQQVTPYVDGLPVSYDKGASGAGTGTFANSTLYFMSRGGANLFGGGSLDEVAIYDQALSASQIATHYATNAG